MIETQPEIPKEPSRKIRLLLFLLSPKVAIPLMMLLALLSAPFMYRLHRINMLPAVGYDPDEVTGFAFGLGIDHFCMLRHNINDIRRLFENDVRFLKQF